MAEPSGMGLGARVGVFAMMVGCTAPPPVVAPVSVPPAPPAPPPPVVVVTAQSAPVLAISPYLVAALPPLGDKHGNAERGVAPSVATHVTLVQRELDQARVRIARTDDRMDRNWTAAFVDAAGKHVGTCKIVAWDAHELECVTALPLDKLTVDVSVEQPTRDSQIKRVLLAQAQGDELLVTFEAGTDNDLGDDWKAELVDDNGIAVPNGSCRIVSVSATLAMCRTPAKVDQLSGVLARR